MMPRRGFRTSIARRQPGDMTSTLEMEVGPESCLVNQALKKA